MATAKNAQLAPGTNLEREWDVIVASASPVASNAKIPTEPIRHHFRTARRTLTPVEITGWLRSWTYRVESSCPKGIEYHATPPSQKQQPLNVARSSELTW